MKDAVEHLAETIAEFNVNARQLQLTLEEEYERTALERVRTARSRKVLSLGVVTVLIVALTCCILLFQSRTRSLGTRSLIRQVASCTTPKEPCYEESVRRENAVVEKLTAQGAAIALCSRTATSDKEFRICVNSTLSKE